MTSETQQSGSVNTSWDITCDYNCWTKLIDDANTSMIYRNVPILMFMVCLMVIGIPGNLLVIVIYGVRKIRTAANCCVIALASVDLTACVLIHPYVIAKLFNSYNQRRVIVCKLFEFLIHSTLAVSGIVLLVVAVDRYLAICKPLKFLTYKEHSTKMLTAAFAFGILTSIPLFEFYGKRTIDVLITEKDTPLKGYICDYSDTYQGSLTMLAFGAATCLCFAVVVVCMAVLYYKVARTAYWRRLVHSVSYHPLPNTTLSSSKARPNNSLYTEQSGSGTQHRIAQSTELLTSTSRRLDMFTASEYRTKKTSQHGRLSTLNTTDERKNTSVMKCYTIESDQRQQLQGPDRKPPSSNPRQQLSCKDDRRPKYASNLKAAKSLFLVTAVFLLSWLPFWVIKFCWIFAPGLMSLQTDTEKMVDRFFSHLFYLNNAANPIIYIIINNDFRKECRLFCIKFRKGISEIFVQRI